MRANIFRSCFFARVAAATVTLAALCVGALPAAADGAAQASVEGLARSFLAKYHLKAAIVQVRSDGAVTQTYAFGESMTGVPAAPAMHFRNGAMAFTYMSTLLLVLVDQNKATLDDKLSAYLPNLPHADAITLRNLANMTSGYADYVYTPELIDGTNANPFRHWTSDELIKIGISKPMMFAPGTNWGYSHTNYVILGRVLEKIRRHAASRRHAEVRLRPAGNEADAGVADAVRPGARAARLFVRAPRTARHQIGRAVLRGVDLLGSIVDDGGGRGRDDRYLRHGVVVGSDRYG